MKSDEELTDGICRMISALGARVADGDPDGVTFLRLVGMRLDESFSQAVTGFRQNGYTDAAIARELGVTRQAVQKRWPR